MKFDKFIQALDMGLCQDQLQRQAVFDLVLFLIVADGVITEEETQLMQQWLDTLEWTNEQSKSDYYRSTILKCYAAIKSNTVEDFLSHRAKLLIEPELKQQAMQLVRDMAVADGELDPTEKYAIDVLSGLLE